jgi:ankyrin repeat protein
MEEFFDAVRRGDAATVATLLRDHPDLARATGAHAKTGLHWAAETDQVEVGRLLLDAGADLEALPSWGATPLDWARRLAARVLPICSSRAARQASR